MARKQREFFYPEPEQAIVCSICDRVVEKGDGDEHHLIPKHKGGEEGPTVHIHRFCHTKIHSLFTNYELAKTYNTPEKIREHPDMAAFIKWVANKPSNFKMKNDRHGSRKGIT